MKEDIKHILFTEEEIRLRIKELGAAITKDYAGRSPLLIGVLKGCYVFLGDIARCIDLDCEIRFITASSYGMSTVSSGDVRIGIEFDFEISGRDVIIIEDILDSGITLNTLRNFILARSPATLKVCTLLDKKERRQAQVEADYVGFICPDEFVVGFGLDYSERYRNLPYVATLKPEVYS